MLVHECAPKWVIRMFHLESNTSPWHQSHQREAEGAREAAGKTERRAKGRNGTSRHGALDTNESIISNRREREGRNIRKKIDSGKKN